MKLRDKFIIACGEAGGSFVLEKETNKPICWLQDPDEKYHPEYPEETYIRLDTDKDVVINGLMMKNLIDITYSDFTIHFKSKHADLAVSHSGITGLIE